MAMLDGSLSDDGDPGPGSDRAGRSLNAVQPTGLPPHDIAAEEAVIAALVIDEDAIHRVLSMLQPMDFYREQNQWAYEAAIRLTERGWTITIPTVAYEMARAGQLDPAGGEPYLAEIAGKFFTAIGVEAHARIVRDTAAARRGIAAANQIAQLFYGRGGIEVGDFDRVMHLAREALDAVEVARATAGSISASEVVDGVEAGTITDVRPTISTGLRRLDQVLAGGFGLGELVTIGAHTSVGKTAMAVRIAEGQALRGIPVGYIPVEGMALKILHRMAAHQSGVSQAYAQHHGWGLEEQADYTAQFGMLSALPIHFPKPVPTRPDAIEHWMRRMARSEGVKHFIIDHVDRVIFETSKGQSMAGAYRSAMTRWGNLAGEEGCVVTMLSQVNRDAGWHPSIADLRESGAKEELSQIVMMLSQGEGAAPEERRREQTFRTNRWGQRRGTTINLEVAKLTEGRIGWLHHEGVSPLFIDAVSGALMEEGE